ncbi:MAG: hypothetical protein B7X53_15240 [Hyphomonas sp. 34-62-18]|nr:hypothetical protein [Hyphomonas sp. 34-62-18]OZB13831.1 MAG: hypothetical protein B7X53_15240 [Hyphomonas sp. 34-62-18]
MSQVSRKNGKSGHWTSKDAEDFKKQAESFSSKVTASPAKAREYLEKLGTHTSTGKLTKRYGG